MIIGFRKLKYICYLNERSFNLVAKDENTFQRTEK